MLCTVVWYSVVGPRLIIRRGTIGKICVLMGFGWGGVGGLITFCCCIRTDASSCGIIATSRYAWWLTSADAMLVLRLHVTDATLRMLRYVRRGKSMQFLSFFGLHDGLGWDLVTCNNILLLLLHPRRRSSYCIIATAWYVWWCTSAGATLVLHLHTTDVCTLRMSLIPFLSHQVHAWAWRKNLGHLNAVGF